MAPSSREGTLWEMSPDSKQQDKKESGRCHKRKGHADNSALMAQINEIVSGAVAVTKNTSDNDNKKFDISKIDFDRLRREFERVQNKNLLLKDLQTLVEQRLAQMMSNNPLRLHDLHQRCLVLHRCLNRHDAHQAI